MSILTMRRRRSRDGERRRGGAGRLPWAVPLAGAAVALMLHGTAEARDVTVDLGALGALPPASDEPAEAPVHLHAPKATMPAKRAPRRAAAPRPQHKPAVDAARTLPPKTPPAAAAEPPRTQPAAPPVSASAAPEAATAAPPLPGMLQIPPPPVLPPPALPAATAATAPAKAAPAKTAAATPPAKQPPPRAETAAAKPAAAETMTARLVFPAGAVELSAEAKAELDRCAKRLAGDPQLRAEIDGYAEAGDASQARRISLSRVLAARGYLVERGVDVKQVDVRPVGNHTQPGLPADRVALVIAEQ